MIEELRTQLALAHRRLVTAQEAGLEHEVHQHRSRIDDLIEMAIRHGFDVRPWPDEPHITHVPCRTPGDDERPRRGNHTDIRN